MEIVVFQAAELYPKEEIHQEPDAVKFWRGGRLCRLTLSLFTKPLKPFIIRNIILHFVHSNTLYFE